MSYGTNAPQGLKPNRYKNGSPWTGTTNQYPITSGYGTSIFTNDPVKTLSDGTIGIGVAGTPSRGVFMGVKYTDTTGTYKFFPYWPASTTVQTGSPIYALIEDDPNLVMDIQETDGSSGAGTPLAAADVNLNINFVVGAGTTSSGQSTSSINNTTEASTASLNLKIMALTPNPVNVIGSFANWLCAWNNHELNGGTGTSGI